MTECSKAPCSQEAVVWLEFDSGGVRPYCDDCRETIDSIDEVEAETVEEVRR